MPSFIHEAIVHLFKDRPELAAEILRELLKVKVPAYSHVRTESADFSQLVPTEYRADLVVVLETEGKPVLGIIVEVQLGTKEKKWLSWPVYMTTLRASLGCETCVLVVTPFTKVARWARQANVLGPGNTWQANVLGPELVPAIEEVEVAQRQPEIAMLSALAHGRAKRDPQRGARVAVAALKGLLQLDSEHAVSYSDLILSKLGRATRRALEELMGFPENYEFQSDFARKYFALGIEEGKAEGEARGKAEGEAEGEARGKAEGILRVLARRGVEVSEAQRAHVLECRDLEQLDLWLDLAVTAEAADELFS